LRETIHHGAYAAKRSIMGLTPRNDPSWGLRRETIHHGAYAPRSPRSFPSRGLRPTPRRCNMDRVWHLTWTTYGTRLPRDSRGFVSNVRDGPGPEVRHNTRGTPLDADMPGLVRAARKSLKCPPIYLIQERADAILPQFQETATYRGWTLLAAAVM